jgi:hypothetical protein
MKAQRKSQQLKEVDVGTKPKLKIPSTFTYTRDVTSIGYLTDILSFRRFAGSEGEDAFIKRYIQPVEGIKKDKYGNYYMHIPQSDGSFADSAFTAHTDTVHVKDGMQPIYMVKDEGVMTLSTDGKDVLGSDDGTGIWLILNMIHAKIPGTYIFFREEEIGGNGSDYFFKHMVEEYQHINKMYSFDRMDTDSIITHQMGSRCCSDAFAKDVANEFNKEPGFDYGTDPTGSFTDSANFTDLIPECTNIAVGYYHQHSITEYQDAEHAVRLRNRLLKVDWYNIGVYRDPHEVEYDYDPYGIYGSADKATTYSTAYRDAAGGQVNYQKIMDLVNYYPDAAAYMLDYLGINEDDIKNLEDEWGIDLNVR